MKNGVSISTEYKGLDPLDQALSQIQFQPSIIDIIDIIDILIRYGAKISFSHRERTLSYLQIDPYIYNELVSKFPQLVI